MKDLIRFFKTINIKPFVKLVDVWFSEEQNNVVSKMCVVSFFLGLIIGFLINCFI